MSAMAMSRGVFSALRTRRGSCTVVCAASPGSLGACSRRAAVLGLSSAAASVSRPAESQAAIGVWDGKKGLGMCDLGEEGVDCRMESLQKDAAKKEDYNAVTNNTYTPASGVPVSDMGSKYQEETFALRDLIMEYLSLEPYDKRRPVLFKEVKKGANDWVGAYARGGNVRKQSARSFYVAVDSLQGHFANNGLAPFPQFKTQKLMDDMDKGCNFILEGK